LVPVTVTWLSLGPGANVEPDPALADRPCALPQLRRIEQRHPDEGPGPLDCGDEAVALPEEAGDRACKRAAGAVRVSGIDPLALPAGHIVGFDQCVGNRVALFMAALDQNRAAVPPDQMESRRDRVLLAGQPIELRQVGSDDGRDVHQLAERGYRGVVGELRAAGRHHHRIEDDRHLLELPQPVGDGFGRKGARDHPDLDRVDADIADDRVDLRKNRLGRHRDAPHRPRGCSAR
jgi:hypothetical protein